MSTASLPGPGALEGEDDWFALTLRLASPGVVRLDASTVALRLGVDTSAVAARFAAHDGRLTLNGEEASYIVIGAGDALCFYAADATTLYSDASVYRLDWSGGTPMAETNGLAGPFEDDGGSFACTRHYEESHYHRIGAVSDPECDYWLWDYVSAGDKNKGSVSFPLEAPGVDETAPAELTAELLGGTSTGVANEHHVVVTVNGSVVTQSWWTGRTALTLTIPLDPGLLRAGTNEVKITALRDAGVAYSILYVESFDLAYKRLYQADHGQLLLRGDGHPVVTVSGFASNDVRVLDLAAPSAPTVLTGLPVGATNGTCRIAFQPLEPGRLYAAFDVAGCRVPDAVLADAPSALRNPSRVIDYLVITPAALAPAAGQYAAYRETRGYRSAVVLLDDIYDEFGHSMPSPHALKAFLHHAATQWTRPPAAVLLLGKGTFDYNNHLGFGDNLLPAVMVSTPQGLCASDPWFSDFDDDGVSDVAIGRIPARTVEQALAVLDKIAAYEAAPRGSWQKRAILSADNPDAGGDFTSTSQRLLNDMEMGGFVCETAHLGVDSLAVARGTLLSAFGSGAAFVSYIGHGALDRLAGEGLLLNADVPALLNAEGTLPVVTAMTCVMGQFSVPGSECLGNRMLNQAGGGASSLWAPSGASWSADAEFLARAFYQGVTVDGEVTLGGAVMRSQRTCAAAGIEPFLLKIYNILGDPALRLTGQAPRSFEEWMRDRFTAAEQDDPDIGGEAGDPDLDGAGNFTEYATGGDPNIADAKAGLLSIGAPSQELTPGHDALVSFVRRKAARDLTYRIELSVDFETWANAAERAVEAFAIDTGDTETERVTMMIHAPVPGSPRCFARLRIIQPAQP